MDIARSPVYGHVTTSVHGLATIRAFRAQPTMETQFTTIQDDHTSVFYMYLASQRWLTFVLDCLLNLYLLILVIVCFAFATGRFLVDTFQYF